jgi:hypothetical protein
MFQQPSFLAKRKSSHGIAAGIPVDRGDQLWSEAVFLVPIGLRARREGVLVEPVLVHHRQFVAVNPKRPAFVPELQATRPGTSQAAGVPITLS